MLTCERNNRIKIVKDVGTSVVISFSTVFIINFHFSASNNLLIKEMFQSRITRTGSLAPSARQQKSRKAPQGVKSAFAFFKRNRSKNTKVGTHVCILWKFKSLIKIVMK